MTEKLSYKEYEKMMVKIAYWLIKNNKKVSEKDNRYFEMAEKYLYNEMAIVLNMTPEDVRNYVIEQVSK